MNGSHPTPLRLPTQARPVDRSGSAAGATGGGVEAAGFNLGGILDLLGLPGSPLPLPIPHLPIPPLPFPLPFFG